MRPPFVGRERERALLLARLGDAVNGRGSVVLVSGEPGIGKTRLAEELGTEAAARGALVAWGRSWEEGGAPPYWPWVQAIRGISERDPQAAVFAEGVLSQLARSAAEPAGDPLAARFDLFDAAARFLRRAAVTRPLILILDDLHAADPPSLLMLRFVARTLRDAPILLIGTYRETEARRAPDVAEILGRIVREGESLPLRGLSGDDVAGLIETLLGRAPSAALAEEIRDHTAGNPLFVDEIVRVLAAEGGIDESSAPSVSVEPRGIAEAIRQRLALLSDESRRALRAAAVLGREFQIDLLVTSTGMNAATLHTLLDEGVAAAEIEPVAGAAGAYRFVHVLIRDALYGELSRNDQAALHLAAADALERSADAEIRVSEIARHRCEALPAGDPALASGAAVRAARRASALIAHEDACRWYERALAIPREATPEAMRERNDLLLALGEARMKAGHIESARRDFVSSAEAARGVGDTQRLAAAALGYAGRLGYAVIDETAVALLEEALQAAGEAASPVRAQLCGTLARALYFGPERDRMFWLAEESVRVARSLEDPPALAEALVAKAFVLRGPDTREERVTTATEIIELAARTGRRERALDGHLARMTALLELGDLAGFEADLEAYVHIAEDLREPRYLLYATVRRAMRAYLDGRYAEGERLAHDALALAERIEDPDALPAFHGVSVVARRESGRAAELLDGYQDLNARYAGTAYARATQAATALLLCDLDRHDEARAVIDPLSDVTAIPRNMDWMLIVALLTEVTATIGDVPRARALAEQLLPYRNHHVVLATAVNYMGAVSRYLGLAAACAGRLDEAESYFREAIVAHEGMRARGWVARTQIELAECLVAAGRGGDEAAELVSNAVAAAEDIGATRLIDRGRGVAVRPPAGTRAMTSASQEASFLHEGKAWRITFEGTAFSVKPQKGLDLLAHLLRHPGREFHVLDLVSLEQPVARRRTSRGAGADELSVGRLGDAGEILDAQAKAAYKRRLDELRGELAEAEEWSDPERAAKAREEMEALVDALAAGVGLGGRIRRAGSSAERARVSVRKALAAAIRRIAEEHPSLGRYLETTVRTGTYCSHVPDPRIPVSWKA